jgi:hypothetical protein
MGKYTNAEEDVFSIFASDSWTSENIKTFPNNYIAVGSGDEFIRVTIIGSGKGINRVSISGVFMVEIFIPAGVGVRRANEIADKLDEYLVNKSVSTVLGNVSQFGTSSMVHNGIDKDSPLLHKSTYTLTFNFFGSNLG